jgi:hypothetical protein
MSFLAVLTPEADKWTKRHLYLESWQVQGNIIGIDHRYMEDIIDGMNRAKLKPDVDYNVF